MTAFKTRAGEVIVTAADGESITCPACGERHPAQLDERNHSFVCTHCDFVRDADKSALMMMLRRAGHKVDPMIGWRRWRGASARSQWQLDAKEVETTRS